MDQMAGPPGIGAVDHGRCSTPPPPKEAGPMKAGRIPHTLGQDGRQRLQDRQVLGGQAWAGVQRAVPLQDEDMVLNVDGAAQRSSRPSMSNSGSMTLIGQSVFSGPMCRYRRARCSRDGRVVVTQVPVQDLQIETDLLQQLAAPRKLLAGKPLRRVGPGIKSALVKIMAIQRSAGEEPGLTRRRPSRTSPRISGDTPSRRCACAA